MRVPIVLLTLFLGGDDFVAGVRAYREGRFDAALAAFAAAEAEAGDAAPPELLYDRALAALRVGRVREAESTAEKLVARGGLEFAGFRAFVYGNAAWQRMERAKAEAGLTDPDPTALARALAHAGAARAAWLEALRTRADWPAARRNLERAERELDELRRRKEEAEAARRAKRESVGEQPDADPTADPDAPPDEVEQAPVLQQDDGALTADQLDGVLALLARKQAEKRAVREKQRAARTAVTERDW